MKKKDCEYGCSRGYCLIYGTGDDSRCKNYKERNVSDSYYDQKAESRSRGCAGTAVGLVIMFIAGICFHLGQSAYDNYKRKLIPEKKLPITGYTVIDYDSVEFSDGTRDTFNWHQKPILVKPKN
jgi:hypothetical protein